MNITHLKTLFIALALGAATLATGFAGEDKEEIVPFDKIPAAVQKTIKAQAAAKGATLGDVEKDIEKGKVVYTGKITTADGKKFEVEVAEDGTLIKVEADDEGEKDGKKGDKKDEDDKK